MKTKNSKKGKEQFPEMAWHQLKAKKDWESQKVVLIKNNFKATSQLKLELKMCLAFCGHSLRLQLKDKKLEVQNYTYLLKQQKL